MANPTMSCQNLLAQNTTTNETCTASRLTNTRNAGRKRRSCVMCSKRKVKCDKKKPCTSCIKTGNECTFPAVAANRIQAGVTPDLVEMLQRLEKVVQTLEPRESDETEAALGSENCQFLGGDHQANLTEQPSDNTATLAQTTDGNNAEPDDREVITGLSNQNQPRVSQQKVTSVSSNHGKSPGRIVRDHGRNTYVRRWFWDDGSTEVTKAPAYISACTDRLETSSGSSSDADDDDMTEDGGHLGESLTSRCHGTSDVSKEDIMKTLTAQKSHLWVIYKERVEPLTKLSHLPKLERAVFASPQVGSLEGMQCIVLAVHYGSVTSLSEDECNSIFGSGQAHVLGCMREELEGLFAGSLLMHTGDIRPLQALTLYLVFLRHHEPKISWKLSGLAIRLAQNFGLHREDSFIGLTTFETEMRRRLWWQLAILDAPSAEDYSGEYNLLEMGSFDTHPPLNLNDAQLHPAITRCPPEKRSITEMTFTLARCQITSMYRCIADSRRICGNTGKTYATMTPEERADWIDDCENDFSESFLRDCIPTNAFHWVTVVLTRMLFHKVRLHGFNPLQDTGHMPESTRERLFLVAVEVIELNYKLRTDPRTRPWLWLFGSYTQWHAFSLVLVWLRITPFCKSSRRAWEAVEKAIVLRWEHPASLLNGRMPRQWRSIIKLLEKARSARREALGKRARRGSRNANDLKRASFQGPPGSSSSAVMPYQSEALLPRESLPGQVAQSRQYCHSPNVMNNLSNASATGPSISPGVVTDAFLMLESQSNNMGQNLFRGFHNENIPGISTNGSVGPGFGQELIMMDGQFSTDDFEGLHDLSFLDDIV